MVLPGISVLALLFTIKNYRRKAGMHVRGVFTIEASRASDDVYIKEIILENLKDRAVTIFSIYLKIGHNYYVELENLQEKPLVLKPFETYRQQFGPIEFYGVNSNKIVLNDLLNNRTVRKQLVLSTADGKYQVPSSIRRWSPVGDFFRNHLTALRANIRETPVVPLINEQGEKEKGRDEWHFSWCSFLGGFGWRGTERRRAKRAAAQWSGSQSGRRLPAGLAS
jgi:hypothetical protein